MGYARAGSNPAFGTTQITKYNGGLARNGWPLRFWCLRQALISRCRHSQSPFKTASHPFHLLFLSRLGNVLGNICEIVLSNHLLLLLDFAPGHAIIIGSMIQLGSLSHLIPLSYHWSLDLRCGSEVFFTVLPPSVPPPKKNTWFIVKKYSEYPIVFLWDNS